MLTPLSPSGLLEAAASGGVSFASDQRGGYVFPAFLPAFDAAAALVRLVSLLEESSASLAEIVDATPAMPILEGEVATPMEQKGLIMRTLMEQLTDEGAELVLVDGIKVRVRPGVGPRRARPRRPGHARLGRGIGPGVVRGLGGDLRRADRPDVALSSGLRPAPVVRYGRPP